tara:strand:+ start:1778 stop:2800 length:1023 start_codon:yes stop_codon:yes gene_type:complete
MLCHKYSPKRLKDIVYHKDICNRLKLLSKNRFVSNIIFNGFSGTGKRTLCYCYLAEIYGENIHDVRVASLPDEKDINYFYSNHHIEIDIGLYKSVQKVAILEFIKSYASTINIGNQLHKVIIFHNSENIPVSIFYMLRRVIEVTSSTARYIFISKNMSSIPEPIRSRILIFNIPTLKTMQGIKVLKKIAIKEDIPYSQIECKKIIKRSYNTNKFINLHDMINFFELSYLDDKKYKKIIHEDHAQLDYLIRLIKKRSISLLQFDKLREIIIDKYIGCYNMKNIIMYIYNNLINDENISDEIKYKIVHISAQKELELLKSNKDVLVIENYLIHLISLFTSSS